MVVVNFNRRELLRRCLYSIQAQSDITREVVVVDNGSHDGSADMVAATFPYIKLIRLHTNTGFCYANNVGIRAGSAPFVALLNNDAEARPDWLAAMVRTAHRHDAAMVACKILNFEDPRKIDKVGHLIFLDGQNRGRGTGQIDDGQFDREEEVAWPDGCACLYRRDMLDRIGLFDEELFAYGDDCELGLRARLAGYSCWYTPEAVVLHRRGETLGVGNPRRVELIERNRVLLVAKHFPWSLIWLNGVLYSARILAGLRAAAKGRGEIQKFPGLKGKLSVALALIKGDLASIPMLPGALRRRSQFRPLRRLSTRQVYALLWKYRITLRELMEQSL